MKEAIFIFGPPAAAGKESWQRLPEDSLFIGLHWGDVIAIEIWTAQGPRRGVVEKRVRPMKPVRLKQATDEYLKRPCTDWPASISVQRALSPTPQPKAFKESSLSGQLRLKEALPLLQRSLHGAFSALGWRPGLAGASWSRSR